MRCYRRYKPSQPRPLTPALSVGLVKTIENYGGAFRKTRTKLLKFSRWLPVGTGRIGFANDPPSQAGRLRRLPRPFHFIIEVAAGDGRPTI